MQSQRSIPDFQVAVDEFKAFAKPRIGAYEMQFDGQAFTHPIVQLVFEAFQAGRAPRPSGQLFASIRKDSKYRHQISWCEASGMGDPFPVRFRASLDKYVLEGGPGGAYRLADVNLFVLHEGLLYRVAAGGKDDD